MCIYLGKAFNRFSEGWKDTIKMKNVKLTRHFDLFHIMLVFKFMSFSRMPKNRKSKIVPSISMEESTINDKNSLKN